MIQRRVVRPSTGAPADELAAASENDRRKEPPRTGTDRLHEVENWTDRVSQPQAPRRLGVRTGG